MLKTQILASLFGVLFLLSGCPSGDDDDVAADDDATADDDDATGDDDDVADDDDAADDDDVGDDDDMGDDDDAAGPHVTATVTVPAGFDGVPVKLYVGYLESWTAGDPVGNGLEIDHPAIADGQPLDIQAVQDGLTGDHIIVVVVYVEGGTPKGEGWPTEGVDLAWYAEAQTLGSDIALGTIEVVPFVMPG